MHQRNTFHLSVSFFLFGLINNGAPIRPCTYTCDDSHKSVVLYVIILSAALDLVPPSTPKGIIAFWNIAPSMFAKFSWPYILKGRIRYMRRLVGCCFLSVMGMIVSRFPYPSACISQLVQVVATSEGLALRLVGIGCASLASGELALHGQRPSPNRYSGLGELTFMQLSTTFHPPSVAGRGVG